MYSTRSGHACVSVVMHKTVIAGGDVRVCVCVSVDTDQCVKCGTRRARQWFGLIDSPLGARRVQGGRRADSPYTVSYTRYIRNIITVVPVQRGGSEACWKPGSSYATVCPLCKHHPCSHCPRASCNRPIRLSRPGLTSCGPSWCK